MSKYKPYPNLTIRYDKLKNPIRYVCDFCLKYEKKPFKCDCKEAVQYEKEMISYLTKYGK